MRIDAAGFTIGLYSGPGTGPVFPVQTFPTNAASFTFTFPGSCPLQPTQIISSTTSTAASLSTALAAQALQFSTDAYSTLQVEIGRLNASALARLTNEITTLSNLVATETSQISSMVNTGVGAVMSTLTSTSSMASRTSNLVATLSTNGAAQIGTNAALSSAISTAQSTADATSGLFTALRTAVIAAATNTPTLSAGGTMAAPALNSDGSSISVTSGACFTNDVCGASYFAANLRTALSNL